MTGRDDSSRKDGLSLVVQGRLLQGHRAQVTKIPRKRKCWWPDRSVPTMRLTGLESQVPGQRSRWGQRGKRRAGAGRAWQVTAKTLVLTTARGTGQSDMIWLSAVLKLEPSEARAEAEDPSRLKSSRPGDWLGLARDSGWSLQQDIKLLVDGYKREWGIRMDTRFWVPKNRKNEAANTWDRVGVWQWCKNGAQFYTREFGVPIRYCAG